MARPIDDKERAAMVADLSEGLGVSEVARKYGRGWPAVDRVRAEAGIQSLGRGAHPATEASPGKPKAPGKTLDEVLRGTIKGGLTVAEIVAQSGSTIFEVIEAVNTMRAGGVNIVTVGDRIEITTTVEQSWTKGSALELVSDENNEFLIGATGDWHVASKYHRDDVLSQLYEQFDEAGVRHVFHTGNWVDGEARFNKFEITAHGIDGQCRALAQALPYHEGIETFAVWGDDHEGWWAQREGVDVGRYAEQIMRDEGRDDWHDLGFMEAHVTLKNANTGKSSVMSVVHPGGGSSYAVSYAIQKIVESLDGGEKPAVGLYGHYHKMMFANIRNVWTVQTGCICDQTGFMRKKKLEAHVGGAIVKLTQDPETGAIVGCGVDFRRWFNRGYYNGRWSYTKPVNRAERVRAG
jgi:hypothetical protein